MCQYGSWSHCIVCICSGQVIMGVIHTLSILGILVSTLWGIEVPTVSIALHVCLQFQHFYSLCELGNLDVGYCIALLFYTLKFAYFSLIMTYLYSMQDSLAWNSKCVRDNIVSQKSRVLICNINTPLIVECQNAKVKMSSPKTPTPKHINQWHFIDQLFVRGIQTGYPDCGHGLVSRVMITWTRTNTSTYQGYLCKICECLKN